MDPLPVHDLVAKSFTPGFCGLPQGLWATLPDEPGGKGLIIDVDVLGS